MGRIWLRLWSCKDEIYREGRGVCIFVDRILTLFEVLVLCSHVSGILSPSRDDHGRLPKEELTSNIKKMVDSIIIIVINTSLRVTSTGAINADSTSTS